MTHNSACRIPGGILTAYILPAFVIALPTIPVYINIPRLYGVDLGLGLAAVGYALLLPRLFDALSDPVVGILSDHFGFRGARRKPWIALGAFISALGLYKVLSPPDDVVAVYLLFWSTVLYGGWTLVSVPYLAWGAELGHDYVERARIASWREGVALLGILGAGGLTAMAPPLGWSEREAVANIAVGAIFFGVFVVALMLFVVPDKSPVSRTRKQKTLSEILFDLRTVLRNIIFMRLLSAWFLNGLANGIPAALFLIYLEHGLGAGPQIRPLFILVYFLAAIMAIPLWYTLSKRFGKHKVWCWAMISASAAFVSVLFLPPGSWEMFGLVCVVTGMALGADLSLPPAIQADVVDYDFWRFGQPRAGVQFALWGMSTKLALAVAIAIALPGLDSLGFDPDWPTQRGIFALLVIYALVPVVLKMAAVATVWSFPLDARKAKIIRSRLERRTSEKVMREVTAV